MTPRIFWKDTAAVYRQQVVAGNSGYSKNELTEVYTGIKCHLAVNNRLHQIYIKEQATAVNKDFVLFYSPRYRLQINDKIIIKTAAGENLELYAGQTKIYTMTAQTQCSFEPIAEATREV